MLEPFKNAANTIKNHPSAMVYTFLINLAVILIMFVAFLVIIIAAFATNPLFQALGGAGALLMIPIAIVLLIAVLILIYGAPYAAMFYSLCSLSQGKSPKLSEIFEFTKKRMMTYFGIYIIRMGLLIALVIVAIILAMIPIIGPLLAVLLAIPGFVIILGFTLLAEPLVALENKGAGDAMRTSYDIFKANLGSSILFLVFYCIVCVILYIPAFVMVLAGAMFGTAGVLISEIIAVAYMWLVASFPHLAVIEFTKILRAKMKK